MKLPENSKLLFSANDIDTIISNMAVDITEDLGDTDPIILCVMNGGMPFTSKLMSKLQFSAEFDYCQVSSYTGRTPGKLKFDKEPTVEMANRTVIICDDIFDTGHTMSALVEYCESRGAFAHVAVLLNKPDRNDANSCTINYCGITIPDYWVYGFGMDQDDRWRNLDSIYYIKNS
jgi:hypoxanthine phosphoribosyltransferase